MFKLGIITCAALPGLYKNDIPLIAMLAAHNIGVTPLVWTEEGINWSAFDALLIRSCWDYYLHTEKFNQWLTEVENAGVPVWNPVEVIRRNLHKFYLRDIRQPGIAAIPTLWLEKGTSADIAALLAENKWQKAIVKPAVSAGAHLTHPIEAHHRRENQELIDKLLKYNDLLVQPFLPEIVSEGEWSLFFFNGRFSHAIVKTPKTGDFRVQTMYGGSAESRQADAQIVESARSIVRNFSRETLLYARVDGVMVGGEFCLMELELIEPDLFFQCDVNAINRFVEAIAEKVKEAK